MHNLFIDFYKQSGGGTPCRVWFWYIKVENVKSWLDKGIEPMRLFLQISRYLMKAILYKDEGIHPCKLLLHKSRRYNSLIPPKLARIFPIRLLWPRYKTSKKYIKPILSGKKRVSLSLN